MTAIIKEKLVRINSRFLPYQHKFIKDLAKKSKGKKGEGEIHREIIQFYIDKHK